MTIGATDRCTCLVTRLAFADKELLDVSSNRQRLGWAIVLILTTLNSGLLAILLAHLGEAQWASLFLSIGVLSGITALGLT